MQRSRTVPVCKWLVYISSRLVYFTLVSVMELPLRRFQRLSRQQRRDRLQQLVHSFVSSLVLRDVKTGRMKMQVRKNQVPGGIIKYGKIKYGCAGVENASTNSVRKVKHNNSPLILRSGKQLSPFSVNL